LSECFPETDFGGSTTLLRKKKNMTIKLGINGFGRIGRLIFRIAWNDPAVEVVAVNDLTDSRTLAHLLKFDSIHGRFMKDIQIVEGGFTVEGSFVRVNAERNPANLNWRQDDVQLVIESTGLFRDAEAEAREHIEGGAERVIITAPASNEDLTVVLGVNEGEYDPSKHFIVSNASCTTNCLAPVAKVLCDEFGLQMGFMNTIHAYTNDQVLLDEPHTDLRRARAGAISMIPSSTGAAKAIGLVMPHMKGKLDGMAMRVPTPDGSAVDLVCVLEKPATKEEINAAMKAAAEGPLKGILEYCEEPIVSIDVIGNPASSIFDAQQTMVMGGGRGTFIKCISWYDNEYAYSCRVIDLAKLMMQ